MMHNLNVILMTSIYFILKFNYGNLLEHCLNNDLKTDPKHGLRETKFWSSKAQDLEQCTKLCIRRKPCQSITYDIQNRSCELNTGIKTKENTREGDTLLYSEYKWWPSNLDKHCFSRPCKESETCVPGSLLGRSTGCDFTCLPVARYLCPLPLFGVSAGRTVGSVNVYNCPKGYIGGGSATCLATKRWDREINTTCVLIFGAECKDEELCTRINGTCSQDGHCKCNLTMTYNETKSECEIQFACGEPPAVPGATVTDSGRTRQYTCEEPSFYPIPTSGSGTITCNETTSTWFPEGYKCGGLRLIQGDFENMKKMPMSGYLEMFVEGMWKAVTYEGWTWKETMVACRKLFGLDNGGTFHKKWYGTKKRSSRNNLSTLGDISCTGEEDLLERCPNFTVKEGEVGKDIALTCFSYNIKGASNVQLANENQLKGTVNVTFNGTIGGLCINKWTDTETKVACKTISPSYVRVDECIDMCPKSEITYIHASRFRCSGDEPHLFFCRNQGWGYADCTSDDLVYITCKDEVSGDTSRE